MPTETKFDSEGFDLGASSNNNEVIYEIGGGATSIAPPVQPKEEESESESPIAQAEKLKELGNNEFRQKNHLDAYDFLKNYVKNSEWPPSKLSIAIN